MSIVSSRHHNCYDHYKLKNYKQLFNCDGCNMKGYGKRYCCNPCGRELHRECRFPATTVTHEHFRGATFKFIRKPFTRRGKNNRREFSKCCDACGKDISGFSYRCEKIDKDLHPCCRNLDRKLIMDHMVFDLRARVSTNTKCMKCKKKKITDGDRDVRGWSYVSGCNKYHFHVFCMVEMVHEACMRHGEKGLERVELREVARSSISRGSRGSKTFEMIKSVVKIMLAALLGDPTMLISNVFVDLVTRGLQ